MAALVVVGFWYWAASPASEAATAYDIFAVKHTSDNTLYIISITNPR